MNPLFTQSLAHGGLARRWLRCGVLRRMTAAAFKVFVGMILLLAGRLDQSTSANAQDSMPLDYQLKAAFLLSFPRYVEWSGTAFTRTNSPLVVAVFGDDNVANELETMIAGGKVVNGHPIVIKRVTREDEINRDCQIVFVSAAEAHRNPGILTRLKDASILTVSENENFLKQGGVINLVKTGRKIRLQVSLRAAEQSHLKISSKLLSVSDVVKD